MQIRRAAEFDLAAITRVQARAMVAADHYQDSRDEEAEYRRLWPRVSGYFAGTYGPKDSLAERTMFVAEEEGTIVGFIAGHRSTRRGCNAELEWMFVLPEWQRQGIGALLLRPLQAWFVARNSARVIVDAPPQNPCRAFYLKHGAVPLDEYWLYWKDIGVATTPNTGV
jgi:GNAT superfamily N-acetyltransferase